MKGKRNCYTVNVHYFNEEYATIGGLGTFLELRLTGASYREIGKYFGFTGSRAHQIGRALESKHLLSKRADIEEDIVKETLRSVVARGGDLG